MIGPLDFNPLSAGSSLIENHFLEKFTVADSPLFILGKK